MSSTPVHTDIADRVLTITIDRPEVRNAVDGPTAEALHEAFQQLDDNDDVDDNYEFLNDHDKDDC